MKEMPVSALMREPYIMNEGAIKPLKTKLDKTMTPFRKDTGTREVNDFTLYQRQSASILAKSSVCRTPIRPLEPMEKVGPKFY